MLTLDNLLQVMLIIPMSPTAECSNNDLFIAKETSSFLSLNIKLNALKMYLLSK